MCVLLKTVTKNIVKKSVYLSGDSSMESYLANFGYVSNVKFGRASHLYRHLIAWRRERYMVYGIPCFEITESGTFCFLPAFQSGISTNPIPGPQSGVKMERNSLEGIFTEIRFLQCR